MCGIVAYIGRKPARELLIEGLRRLEYRGYDSAGIAVLDGGLTVVRAVGRVSALSDRLDQQTDFDGTRGMAHPRGAPHGTGGPRRGNAGRTSAPGILGRPA